MAARPQDAPRLRGRGAIVRDVLEHVEHRHDVERRVLEREVGRVGDQEARERVLVGLGRRVLGIHVDRRHARARVEPPREPAATAADLQDLARRHLRGDTVDRAHLLAVEEPLGERVAERVAREEGGPGRPPLRRSLGRGEAEAPQAAGVARQRRPRRRARARREQAAGRQGARATPADRPRARAPAEAGRGPARAARGPRSGRARRAAARAPPAPRGPGPAATGRRGTPRRRAPPRSASGRRAAGPSSSGSRAAGTSRSSHEPACRRAPALTASVAAPPAIPGQRGPSAGLGCPSGTGPRSRTGPATAATSASANGAHRRSSQRACGSSASSRKATTAPPSPSAAVRASAATTTTSLRLERSRGQRRAAALEPALVTRGADRHGHRGQVRGRRLRRRRRLGRQQRLRVPRRRRRSGDFVRDRVGERRPAPEGGRGLDRAHGHAAVPERPGAGRRPRGRGSPSSTSTWTIVVLLSHAALRIASLRRRERA